ncbi:MAG: exodeoxyribonuclease V subunit alpha [Lysobacteraceae bacterium]
MSAYKFQRNAAEQSVEAWRPLDRALHRWVRAHGGSELLAAVAAWASCADGDGDTALLLRDANARRERPQWSDAEIEVLRNESMVASAGDGARTPFILDAQDRFYLRRNDRHEAAVAAAILQRLADNALVAVAESDIDALFHGQRDAAIAAQREAVQRVVGRKLFVLTGGPGTGKTTTVLRMLLMLQRQRARDGATPLTIQLAAPTGKAAQRLLQALQRGKKHLMATHDANQQPQERLPPDWHDLFASIPDVDALTLHRLLAYDSRRNTFRRNAHSPIAADVVVIDEASMIDLAMLRSLLDAMRPDATLILVGDADQLTSIAAGSVLMDLVKALESRKSDILVRLQHSFRSEHALVAINEAVRCGDREAFAIAVDAAGTDATRQHVTDPQQLARQLRHWSEQFAAHDALRPVLARIGDDAVPDQTATVLAALHALTERQLLCALRDGTYGAQACNAAIENHLRRAWSISESTHWYAGRAILVTSNDYGLRLFNGDIGLCLADSHGDLHAWFETVDADGRPAVRSILPAMLPAHDSAFAITIHKSQGSEYQRVAVLLPPDADNRILSRQLLYTGLSRARRAVELWSAQASLDAALAQPVRRASGLVARLES